MGSGKLQVVVLAPSYSQFAINSWKFSHLSTKTATTGFTQRRNVKRLFVAPLRRCVRFSVATMTSQCEAWRGLQPRRLRFGRSHGIQLGTKRHGGYYKSRPALHLRGRTLFGNRLSDCLVTHPRQFVSANTSTKVISASFLSRKVSFLCRKVSFLSRKVSFLSRKVSFLCRKVSFLSRKVSFLSRKVSFLSRKVSFLSRKVSFLSRYAISVAITLACISIMLPACSCY